MRACSRCRRGRHNECLGWTLAWDEPQPPPLDEWSAAWRRPRGMHVVDCDCAVTGHARARPEGTTLEHVRAMLAPERSRPEDAVRISGV